MHSLAALPLAAALLVCAGCAGAVVEPGHRALFFDPRHGGLQHEVLGPGYYRLGLYGRLEDFDITYSTRKEAVRTTSSEGLQLDLKLAVSYRPIVSELYNLDTEIGSNYYDEVIGPEFRSAARGVFARHSYTDLQKKNEAIEDEIETDIRRRLHGKHVEITSVTMEGIDYAPEIAAAVRAKLVGEQEAARQKAAIENDALRRKLEIEHAAEQTRLKADLAVKEKQSERALAEEQAKIDQVHAEAEAAVEITRAKAESEQRTLVAKARAAEVRAISPLEVQMHAYDALAKLGGQGTHIMIGDWSRVPNFLFPPLVGAGGAGAPYPPVSFSPSASQRPWVVPAAER